VLVACWELSCSDFCGVATVGGSSARSLPGAYPLTMSWYSNTSPLTQSTITLSPFASVAVRRVEPDLFGRGSAKPSR
jgi:hypothetical protein